MIGYIICVIMAVVSCAFPDDPTGGVLNPDLFSEPLMWPVLWLIGAQFFLYYAGQCSRRPSIKHGMHGTVLAVHRPAEKGYTWYTVKWTASNLIAAHKLPDKCGLVAGDSIIGHRYDMVRKV